MRRELRFKNFEDVRQELTRLEKGTVVTTGEWSYFQILTHCAKAVENSMKGLRREMSWVQRHLKGPLGYRAILTAGFLPAGINKNNKVERVEGDEKAAQAQLLKAMEDFEKFEGKLGDHPRFGNLNKKQWLRFHPMHLANHIGNAKLAND